MQAEHGKSWEEMFPPEEYYRFTHSDIPKADLPLPNLWGADRRTEQPASLVHAAAPAFHGSRVLVDAAGGLSPAAGHGAKTISSP